MKNDVRFLEEGKADQHVWADPRALDTYNLLGSVREIVQKYLL